MNYKDTLNLPDTQFPMKANLAEKEVTTLARWEEDDLYGAIREERKGKKAFILHDGPPYANGNIHSGHALNKILKDIIVKAKTMSGFDAPYVPGWDCHGLPIEHQVDKQLGKKKREMSTSEIRGECREYALKYVGIQREEFKRLGILGDWERPYLTLDHNYEIGILKELQKFVANGGLYRGSKPVHWCPSCVTALAEAEVEYADHTSPSIFVKFELTADSARILGLPETQSYVVIWTTTPWTLPANMAVCLHPDFNYSAVKVGDDTLVLAEDLVTNCMTAFGFDDYETVATFNGAKAERLKTRHPFLEKESLVITGGHVTLEQGTGCVHTAPGHGQDDYAVGMKYGLEIYNPVDQYGKFKPDTPHFAGQKVRKANANVITLLEERGALLKREDVEHSYPHCWRCRGPIIFRATPQWFLSMEKNQLRQKALEAIRSVEWKPGWGENRIYGMVENRPDWCVSRQRVWGAPITAFYCEECDETLMDENITDHVIGILEKEGVDVWFDKPAGELLPDNTKCSNCGSTSFTKSSDILDVWFDSGVSHSVVVKDDPRFAGSSDLYLEGSDQHRGWFHTSLLESVGSTGKAPYREVLTHGYVVDGSGKKMSKSLGNVIAPQTIIDKYGAEIVRLWVAGEDYTEDIRLSDVILKRLTEAYRKIRNTIRFMLGNLSDFDPDTDMVPYSEQMELDKVIHLKFARLIEKVTTSYDMYDFHVFYHSFHNFCVLDLSSFYLDIVKDRIYTFPAASFERRSAQSAMYELTHGMLRLMAPVLSFTAEEAWDFLPHCAGSKKKSVHMTLFPATSVDTSGETLLKEWERIVMIRGEVSTALEKARRNKEIGHSLDARVTLSLFKNDYALLENREKDLAAIFIVSQAELNSEPLDGNSFISETIPGLTVKVERAHGDKCERCWNYDESVGHSDKWPTVCSKCANNLAAII